MSGVDIGTLRKYVCENKEALDNGELVSVKINHEVITIMKLHFPDPKTDKKMFAVNISQGGLHKIVVLDIDTLQPVEDYPTILVENHLVVGLFDKYRGKDVYLFLREYNNKYREGIYFGLIGESEVSCG